MESPDIVEIATSIGIVWVVVRILLSLRRKAPQTNEANPPLPRTADGEIAPAHTRWRSALQEKEIDEISLPPYELSALVMRCALIGIYYALGYGMAGAILGYIAWIDLGYSYGQFGKLPKGWDTLVTIGPQVIGVSMGFRIAFLKFKTELREKKCAIYDSRGERQGRDDRKSDKQQREGPSNSRPKPSYL